MPKERLIEHKKYFINELNWIIRHTLNDNNNSLRISSLRILALLCNDRCQEVSSTARKHMGLLFNDNKLAGGTIIYSCQEIEIQEIIGNNDIIDTLKRAIKYQIITFMSFSVALIAVAFSRNPILSYKDYFMLVENFTAFTLNILAVGRIFFSVDRTFRYGINLDSTFYQFLSIMLISNLVLLAVSGVSGAVDW